MSDNGIGPIPVSKIRDLSKERSHSASEQALYIRVIRALDRNFVLWSNTLPKDRGALFVEEEIKTSSNPARDRIRAALRRR